MFLLLIPANIFPCWRFFSVCHVTFAADSDDDDNGADDNDVDATP